MKRELGRAQGEIVFTRRNTDEVRDSRDSELWRQQFTDKPLRPRGRGRAGRDFSRDVRTQFLAPPVRTIKAKEELDDSKSVASGVESVAGSVKTAQYRAESGLSESSSCRPTQSRRDWYNPHNWRHGGLR